MSAWKPGDVAMVTADNRREPYAAHFDGKVWRDLEHGSFCVVSPTSHRPLVVIDAEDREQVERLREALVHHTARPIIDNELQAALRSLTRPPKPEEPQGLGAVVEDAEGRKWLRVDWTNPWCLARPTRRDMNVMHGSHKPWNEINAVKVLSDGVTP